MVSSSKILSRCLVLLAACPFGLPGEATAAAHMSTYVFVPEQSKVVQTGGIAYVHWTYSVKGKFQLTIDPDAGTASFAHVDANATDDSPFKRTLDPNHVFNMTSLVGTVEPSGSIKFMGKASDDSDVGITVSLQDGLANLIGQTTPPPNSADFFIFSLDAVAQLRKYGGGSGTADDPYQIGTAEDLLALGETPEDYDKHFILTADIDLDPNLPKRKVFDKAVITPGTATPDWPYFQGFTGVFHGGGHTISNLRIIGTNYLGLFGLLGFGAQVKNLGVVDANITGSDFVGGLVGWNNGSVTHCYSSASVSGTGEWSECVGGLAGLNGGAVTDCYSTGTSGGASDVGGLVGANGRGHVTQCYSTAAVSGEDCVGGLVGGNFEGTVTDCYSTGVVSGTASYVGGLVGGNNGDVARCYTMSPVTGDSSVGGLVGQNGFLPEGGYPRGSVVECYSTGTVSGKQDVGGLVGFNLGGGGPVTDCYSTGAVSGNLAVGGVVGDNWDEVVNSFWDIQTSRQDKSDGGTGKTTAEMQTAKTFLEAGWDFVNIWGIGENQTYPYLRKYSAADINQNGSVNLLDLSVLAENWLEGFD